MSLYQLLEILKRGLGTGGQWGFEGRDAASQNENGEKWKVILDNGIHENDRRLSIVWGTRLIKRNIVWKLITFNLVLRYTITIGSMARGLEKLTVLEAMEVPQRRLVE